MQSTSDCRDAREGREDRQVRRGTRATDLFIARTGYTGEDGYEIIVPHADAVELWKRLDDAGVAPAGLGARDTLRLEAGMNLYGQDMDEAITPWEAGLAWTVSLDSGRDFIGRAALEKQQADGVERDDRRSRHGRERRAAPRPARRDPERRRRNPVGHVFADARQIHRVRPRACGARSGAQVDIRGKLAVCAS